jgi:hypothetical protein
MQINTVTYGLDHIFNASQADHLHALICNRCSMLYACVKFNLSPSGYTGLPTLTGQIGDQKAYREQPVTVYFLRYNSPIWNINCVNYFTYLF